MPKAAAPPRSTHKLAQINPYESHWVVKVKITRKYPARSFTSRGATQKVFNVEMIDDQVRFQGWGLCLGFDYHRRDK